MTDRLASRDVPQPDLPPIPRWLVVVLRRPDRHTPWVHSQYRAATHTEAQQIYATFLDAYRTDPRTTGRPALYELGVTVRLLDCPPARRRSSAGVWRSVGEIVG